MKLARLLARRVTTTNTNPSQNPIRNLSLSYGLTTWYSTETTTTHTSKRYSHNKDDTLYRRISPLGYPNTSIVPVLDQWVEEGRTVDKKDLISIIRELRHYRRLKHALEISQWMTDKRYMKPTVADFAIRLDLIAKVDGIEQAENFFNNIPKQLRKIQVYGALLSCYSHAKCVDKAEAVMQKMKELGFGFTTLNYNLLLNLYLQTGNREKIDSLLHELEVKGINYNKYTYVILLNAYGADSDINGIEKILTKLESDSKLDSEWNIYAVAANHYLKAGLVDKGYEMLRKSEKLIALAPKKNEAFSFITTMYATAGKKEDVLRIWNKCKEDKVSNLNYKSVLSSILRVDDLDTAEKIFEGWESSDLTKDIRIPNFLLGAYCKRGMMDKAEALLEKVTTRKWEKADVYTWSNMSFGYARCNQMPKAVEAMELAVWEWYARNSKPSWKPEKHTLTACLKHLKEEGNEERSGEFLRLLNDKGVIPGEVHAKLVAYFSGECGGNEALEDKPLFG